MEYKKLYLKKGKESSLKRFHPWVFSGALQEMTEHPAEGEIVEVFTFDGEYIATGHYQPEAISVRILSFKQCSIGSTFWEDNISQAAYYRKQAGLWGAAHTNVFRLVNAEGDGLPGLIIDFYNGVAVIQCHSSGMFLAGKEITEALIKVLGCELMAVYNKSGKSLPFRFEGKCGDGFLYNCSESEIIVTENNNKFIVDIAEGQKTGFFIDQRESRKLVSQYVSGKSVANIFSYSGGFSVYALNSGATTVHSVDSSEKAISLAERNIVLNNCGGIHKSFIEDVSVFLNRSENLYDVIILDPPAFAKHGRNLKNALLAYKRLNEKALKIINKGGILFTFSCSQVVSPEDFRRTVMMASVSAQRDIKIIHNLTHPPDHPVSVFHPEGAYLKGLALKVY